MNKRSRILLFESLWRSNAPT